MANSKKPAPKLKLRVGGVYEDGDGNECRIVSANPYTDHYGMRYQKSGRCDSEWRNHDLIREVVDLPAPDHAAALKVLEAGSTIPRDLANALYRAALAYRAERKAIHQEALDAALAAVADALAKGDSQ